MVGNVTVAGLAWLVIPRQIDWNIFGLLYNSWRIFVAVSVL